MLPVPQGFLTLLKLGIERSSRSDSYLILVLAHHSWMTFDRKGWGALATQPRVDSDASCFRIRTIIHSNHGASI